jgi:predicted nucleotidyltransferase
MGRTTQGVRGGITSALFTPVQQRVLGLLFGQADRRFQSAEIIRLARSGTGAVHRQLQRLVATGLVLASREGNQKYYCANPESPVFPELHGLMLKTAGVVEPLRAALARFSDRIHAAFVFGSVAKGKERASSDLDLFILGEGIEYSVLYAALQGAEARLARPVNPTVMSRAEWKQKISRRNSFAARVATEPKLFVIGDESALG